METAAPYLPDCDTIRRQLLGASVTGGRGYTSPTEDDTLLKSWIESHG